MPAPADFAVIAWDCIGFGNGFNKADFNLGGSVQADTGLCRSGGGGAIVSCSEGTVDPKYQGEFNAACALANSPR